jgi:F-type H+-transporting ATPase subunit b
MEEIAQALEIDWGIIITQIIGFLIALWILKAFAWKPLLKMLDDRRNKIVGDIDDAEKIKADADNLLEEYKGKLRDIDTEARAKIQEAISEGTRIASEIREQAREESRQVLAKSREELSRDVAKARVQLRDDIVNMALGAAEKVISAKLDEGEQKRILDDFLKEVDRTE